MKVNEKDLPAFCIFLSSILLLQALVLMYGWKLNYIDKRDLYEISGVVESFVLTDMHKAGQKMHIFLNSNAAHHHLTQNNLTKKLPLLLSLKQGDFISVLVASDCCFRDLLWVWGIKRNDNVIMSYEDMVSTITNNRENNYTSGLIEGCCSLFLAVIGLLLRNKYGRWTG